MVSSAMLSNSLLSTAAPFLMSSARMPIIPATDDSFLSEHYATWNGSAMATLFFFVVFVLIYGCQRMYYYRQERRSSQSSAASRWTEEVELESDEVLVDVKIADGTFVHVRSPSPDPSQYRIRLTPPPRTPTIPTTPSAQPTSATETFLIEVPSATDPRPSREWQFFSSPDGIEVRSEPPQFEPSTSANAMESSSDSAERSDENVSKKEV